MCRTIGAGQVVDGTSDPFVPPAAFLSALPPAITYRHGYKIIIGREQETRGEIRL
jgi:hypothetical protein